MKPKAKKIVNIFNVIVWIIYGALALYFVTRPVSYFEGHSVEELTQLVISLIFFGGFILLIPSIPSKKNKKSKEVK